MGMGGRICHGQELGARRIVLQRANILEEVPNMSYEEKEHLARKLHIIQTKSIRLSSYTWAVIEI